MGLYNTITTSMQCSHCGWNGEVEVQFKYGNLHDHEYGIGSRIVWGRTEIGNEAERCVAVEGIAACPQCGQEPLFDIIIDGGIIRSVEPSSGRFDYHHGEGHYVIINS
jgi:hypothetical protein